MVNLNPSPSLTDQDKEFCEKFVLGKAPFKGDVVLCYASVFNDKTERVYVTAYTYLHRDDIQEYVEQLRELEKVAPDDVKSKITQTLVKIMDETSTAIYTNRQGRAMSPAPLRAVGVQAAKALMDIHPIKVVHESKVELTGENGSGVVINVVAPQSTTPSEDEQD